ncbi:hypothetical protein PSTG_13840 [Puccinia striiformis f. sp. tritici PST-78]|uniref:Uncharacterized protein n=1 Tax=Puccinia striiformis f. sp. tritici PST-78 TaxID=1165861 RepID=A0A0L0V0H6_9BASI|nr:hypothetical protein PSTG_13840 [Puccinia striiformis f. sp. tritici PST-78]
MRSEVFLDAPAALMAWKNCPMGWAGQCFEAFFQASGSHSEGHRADPQQARWHILKTGSCLWEKHDVMQVMTCCIVSPSVSLRDSKDCPKATVGSYVTGNAK